MSAAHRVDARAAAAGVLHRVLVDGRSLDTALPGALARLPDDRERALCQELCYGVLRWRGRLEAVLERLLTRPLRARDADVGLLALVGLYQLVETAVPPHAAVATTVQVARSLRRPWAAGLLNALLRRFQRERDALLAAVDQAPAARHAVPFWLLEALRRDWPADWEAVLVAGNARPPMTLRVNRCRVATADYAARLSAAGLVARPVAGAPAALTLDQPVPVAALPGFADGLVAVQDAAAQLAAPLLDPKPGERVLDACAAPGGKTAHLLAQADGLDLTAVDVDTGRLERVRENLGRLGGHARLIAGDAAAPERWWDGRPFQRILLDAPCSGSGVIRRHPDIKWLRRAEDIETLAGAQRRLLAALWPLLAPGGRLVYATCSLLRAENEAVVAEFLEGRTEAAVVAPGLRTGRALDVGHQILPGEAGMDGFYYACLEKR